MQDKLILLVDDDVIIRQTVKRYLKRQGYEVKTLSNGFKVLLLTRHLKPDLIISDFLIPKLDGIKLLRGLRNSSKTRHIPVILISAIANEDLLEKARKLGAASFLNKPFPLKDLDKTVETALGEAHRQLAWA